ncbi:MAG: hypothetical protein AB9M60_18940 [Leptothrix sp. (in: b-proteobacteria)]
MISTLERQLFPFLALQAALSTLVGFGAVLVCAEFGVATTVHYTLILLAAAMAGPVLAFGCGHRLRLDSRALVRGAFALPALLLPWADGRPVLLALALGGFLGLSWAARHWIELSLIDDAQRDAYAAHTTVLSVGVSLLATLGASLWLSGAEAQAAVQAAIQNAPQNVPQNATQPGTAGAAGLYRAHALLALLAMTWAARRLPATPGVHCTAPWQVLRQPAWRASLPLYFLESGLLGIGMVMGASGAVRALGQASHYGWVATLATVAGAVALYALRHRRHAGNRERWMALACIGITLAQGLLGASALWPLLYVAHLLLQAGVGPFWSASEQVLNQRTMDVHGALGDRIVVREATLGVFRLGALLAFWWAVQALDARLVLAIGAALMALATALEFAVGRAWLRRHDAPAAPATQQPARP